MHRKGREIERRAGVVGTVVHVTRMERIRASYRSIPVCGWILNNYILTILTFSEYWFAHVSNEAYVKFNAGLDRAWMA